MDSRQIRQKVFFLLGSTLLIFTCAAFLTAVAGFFCGLALTRFHIFAAILLTAAYIKFATQLCFPDGVSISAILKNNDSNLPDWLQKISEFCKKKLPITTFIAGKFSLAELRCRQQILPCVILLLTCSSIFIVCMLINGELYDLSYDGQVYHQEAVIQLATGWNPWYETIDRTRSNPAVLLNHYAKGPWIYEAVLYKATGSLEMAKAFNLSLVIASAFLLSAFLSCCGIRGRRLGVLCLLTACNPVALCQVFSFYIDGQLASLLLCLGALLLCYSQQMFSSLLSLLQLTVTAVVILIVNVKFTGVVYVCALIGLLALRFGWRCYQQCHDAADNENSSSENNTKERKVVSCLASALLGGLLAGVIFFGFNPYVMNTWGYGHPFYPLYTRAGTAMDIMTTNAPEPFREMSALGKLAIATFSQSANKLGNEGLPVLKWPFSLAMQELKPFLAGADVRVAGFGPWFSASLVLAFLTLCWTVVRTYQTSVWPKTLAGCAVVAAVLCDGMINPEAWWARYAPQFWFLPAIVAAVAFLADKQDLRRLGKAVLVIMAVNLCLIAGPYLLGNYLASKAMDSELAVMLSSPVPVAVDFREFRGNSVRLTEKGISFMPLWWALPPIQNTFVGCERVLSQEDSAIYYYEVDMRVIVENCLWYAQQTLGLDNEEEKVENKSAVKPEK